MTAASHSSSATSGRRTSLVLVVGAAAALAAIAQLGVAFGQFASVAAFRDELARVGPVTTAASLGVVVAAVAAIYVICIGSLALVASFGKPTGVMARLVRRVTLPALRWALPSVITFGAIAPLGASPVGAVSAAARMPSIDHSTTSTTAAPSSTDDDALFVLLDDDNAASTTTTTELATFVLIEPDGSSTTSAPAPSHSSHASTVTTAGREASTLVPSTSPAVPTTSLPEAQPARPVRVAPNRHPARVVEAPDTPAADAQWTVQTGDHLWHIAQATLARHHGRPASDAETAGYLQALIAANTATFVDPGNADLILPGQVFSLPPVSAGRP